MRSIVATLACVLAAGRALEAHDRDPHLAGPCILFDSTMASATSFAVCTPELLDTPAWRDPETTEPPLSRADAAAISKRQLRSQLPETKSWELVGVELLTTWLADDRWFYIVTWRPTNWRDEDQGDTARVGVLMNGKALKFKVEAKPRPKALK